MNASMPKGKGDLSMHDTPKSVRYVFENDHNEDFPVFSGGNLGMVPIPNIFRYIRDSWQWGTQPEDYKILNKWTTTLRSSETCILCMSD